MCVITAYTSICTRESRVCLHSCVYVLMHERERGGEHETIQIGSNCRKRYNQEILFVKSQSLFHFKEKMTGDHFCSPGSSVCTEPLCQLQAGVWEGWLSLLGVSW